MINLRRAIQVQDNVVIGVILVESVDNPLTYDAFWAPNDDTQVGWQLQNGNWVDPTPVPAVEPELTAEQIAAALGN